jgi:excinuclease ABC subunit A
MHVRVLLSRYRVYTPCPDCHGTRFKPETLLYRVNIGAFTASAPNDAAAEMDGDDLTLARFYQLPIRDSLRFIHQLEQSRRAQPNDPLGLILAEVRSRLNYLDEVGLGYLTLDRPTRSLSGGETERVNLTTCLGTRLVNTLFVLDEPSVGLHPRDTARLVRILEQLRDAGNTVVVVEHEPSVMRAANQIVDLGPGHGATGGQIVFQGTYPELLKSAESLTGQYLSGRKEIETPARRFVGTDVRRCESSDALVLNEAPGPFSPETEHATRPPSAVLRRTGYTQRQAFPRALTLSHATCHNLRDLTVRIPLGRLVCVTGVSGSGKTTLIREVLLPALNENLRQTASVAKASDRLAPDQNGDEDKGDDTDTALGGPPATSIEGFESLGRAVLVDQSILGKTPRSNPAVYVGAFDDIREFFAQTDQARQRALNASAFSFNSGQGQCERCRGAGFEKIEMQFLSDVFIRCPDCNGRRYRAHILEVKVAPRTPHNKRPFSIADLLDSTVEDAAAFLGAFPDSRPAQRAAQSLKLLQEVGLGYLKLGQPINTLSGGESQRLKLVRELAEATGGVSAINDRAQPPLASDAPRPTLFLFDEPTTGLHFDDVRLLLKVFQRLVDGGHSVLVIEHNLEVIKSADWIIDLGPDAGDRGGQLVAQGTPEDIARCIASHTGQALREVLLTARTPERISYSNHPYARETRNG